MKNALVAGLATGAALGTAARRWWDRKTQFGPWGSVAAGLSQGVDSVDLALLQTTATQLVPGNRLTPRDNGEVFDAIEAAIRAARHSVHFDVYIWKPGVPGDRIADLVCRRAREGIAVRVLVDPMGSKGFEGGLRDRLLEAGCEVYYFRARRHHLPVSFTGRNHRKLVVVDGRVGFARGGSASRPSGPETGSPHVSGGTPTSRSRVRSSGRCRWRSRPTGSRPAAGACRQTSSSGRSQPGTPAPPT